MLESSHIRPFRAAWWLTLAMLPLAALAASLGLFRPSIYRETSWVIPQNRGQDFVTLMVVVGLAAALMRAHTGSVRAILIWSGLLGYVWYTYVGAAFSYHFNELFLVYVACFSLSTAALIGLFGRLDVDWVRSSFSRRAPRRSVTAFLFGMAAILSTLWLSQVVQYLTTGKLPDLIVRAQAPTNFVFVLDLGVIVPLSVLAATLLLKGQAWGYAIAGAMLLKAATMGAALVSMTIFSAYSGQPIDINLAAFWLALAAGGSMMSICLFASCDGNS